MDLQLVKNRFNISRRNKKLLISLAVFGFSSYGLYKWYNTPSVVRKRKRVLNLLKALISILETVSDSSEIISVVSKDLKQFLESNSGEIPNSLKQLSKIARSDEFSKSLIRVSEAMTVGILKGYCLETRKEIGELGDSSFSDRVMDKLMSSTGSGFVSVVVGSFARNLILGFYSSEGSHEGLNGNNQSDLLRWVDVISNEKCTVVIADCIQKFVSTAVGVYLEKTMSINFYDEMFAGLTNPKHQKKVRDILVSFCNGAVETLVKTSHQVLTSSKADLDPSSSSGSSVVDQSEARSRTADKIFKQQASSRKLNGMSRHIVIQNRGWVSSISSTLAVPSNRSLVLDVTGRVTFETMRSLVEFFLWKVSDGLKRSYNFVHEEVVDRGLQVIRYVGSKSYVILIICLALFFLYVWGSTRDLVPV